MTDSAPQSPAVVPVSSRRRENGDSSPPRKVRIKSPEALVSVVPYLLGYHPGRDMVIIGTWPPHGTARITLRYSLPYRADAQQAAASVRNAILTLSARQYPTAVAVFYGPDAVVKPFVARLRDEAGQHEIRFTEILRVDTRRRRYWSYLCENPGCCPPEGASYELTSGAAVTGLLAGDHVLPSREALAALVAPCSGEEALSMAKATRKAVRRETSLFSQKPRPGKPSGRYAVALAGIKAMKQAIQAYRQGNTLTHDETAWLTVSLRDQWVRDDAMSRMETAHLSAHLRLWTDVTHLAQPEYVTAPATLLAFVAWQSGNGTLANIALERVVAADPGYSLAHIVSDLLDSSMWPEEVNPLMTPEEVAEAYAGYYRADV